MTMFLILLCCSLLSLTGAQDNEIRLPPSITKPVSAEQRVVNGKSPSQIEITCQATGQPAPKYEWYKDTVQLPANYPNIAVDTLSGMLTIQPTTPADAPSKMEGSYTCRAKTTFPDNNFAVAISDPVTLTVVRVSTWTSTGPEEKTAAMGTYTVISCRNVPTTFGQVNFQWTIQDSSTSVIGDQLVPDERKFVDQTGKFHFVYTVADDASWYLCSLKTAYDVETGPDRTQLKVTAGTATDTKPVLQASSRLNDKLTYELGTKGYMECVFSGYDSTAQVKTPTITWYDGAGKEIHNDTKYAVSFFRRYLEIKDLQESDQHPYKCVGANRLGTAEDIMTLNVTSKPIWSPRALDDMEVAQGRDATLYCRTRSAAQEQPPDPPVWLKNGVPMSQGYDPNKFVFSPDKQTLTVKNPQKATDIACFQCYVSNSVGTTFSSGCLNIVIPIAITTRPKADQSILAAEEEGHGQIDLTVVATSDPLVPPLYQWIFKDQTYENDKAPPRVVYNPITKQAYINITALSKQEKEALAGTYTRRVYNRVMSELVNISVTYEEKPPPPVAVASFPYWIIGVIIAALIIILVIIIIVCVCCRRKMQEGDYYVDKKEKGAGHNPEKELKDSGFKDLSRLPSDQVYDNYGFPDDEKLPMPRSKANSVDIKDIYRPNRQEPDDFDEQEYDQEPPAGFNEDGSFVGQYNERDNPSPPPTPTHEPRRLAIDRSPRSPTSFQAPTASHESLV